MSENHITIPARHITAGDHFWGWVVFSLRNLPDGSREFHIIVPYTAISQTLTVKADQLDNVTYPVTKRGDTHSPNRRNEALGLPLEEPPVYVEPKPIAHYPKGTPIGEVHHFDRGQKVSIECKNHPGKVYWSKDPYTSSWFSNPDGVAECRCSTNDYLVAADYNPTRNG
jgi:hypothetical protein